jgi:formiminoglutamase
MSGASSSAAEWSTRLEPARPPADLAPRADDPRLGEIVEFWTGDPASLRPGRAVLLGFPQDEGVRRNKGRPGAAEAPAEIRRCLHRLTPWDGETNVDLSPTPPLDLGNLRIDEDLEQTQAHLGEIVAALLERGAVPIVLGGGHETAYGVYLGYVATGRPVGIVNIDAHLDVRPLIDGLGDSGSPFRQVLEHPTCPLAGERYVCLGAQPGSVGREHWQYARDRGSVIGWCDEVRGSLVERLAREAKRLAADGCGVHLTLDADAVRAADVPGVSAPNPTGLAGEEVIAAARWAGQSPHVAGLDLVEINPRFDRDAQSARWAALVIWNFLIGLRSR